MRTAHLSSFFFFNDTATTEIYTLSLHDALPISFDEFFKIINGFGLAAQDHPDHAVRVELDDHIRAFVHHPDVRSEEHTSELQSQSNLVCRLLLEKKKKIKTYSLVTTIDRIRLHI